MAYGQLILLQYGSRLEQYLNVSLVRGINSWYLYPLPAVSRIQGQQAPKLYNFFMLNWNEHAISTAYKN